MPRQNSKQCRQHNHKGNYANLHHKWGSRGLRVLSKFIKWKDYQFEKEVNQNDGNNNGTKN